MVSYGDAGFRNWAESNGFDDNDLLLIKKTVGKRKWIWLVLSLIFPVGVYFIPFYVTSKAWYCFLIDGSFDNFDPRGNIISGVLTIIMYVSFISIIPFILWKLVKKNLWGTGINGLVKKGLVGGHSA